MVYLVEINSPDPLSRGLAMMETQKPVRRQSWFFFGMAIGTIALTSSALLGQETPQVVEIRAEAGKAPLVSAVGLRPNTPTRVALFLQNPGEEELRNVVVKLVQTDVEDRILAQTLEVEKLPAKAKVRLTFPKGKDKKEKEKD